MKIKGNCLISVGKNITGEVYIPDGITEIYSTAFNHCKNLKSVSVPFSFYSLIEDPRNDFHRIFSNIKIYYRGTLKQWFNPNTRHFENIFYDIDLYINNKRIVDLIIPDDINQIPSFVFCHVKSLRSVKFNSVTSVYQYAFFNCRNLKYIDFGQKLEFIDHYAFAECINLKKLVFPDSLKKIWSYAFYDCVSIKHISGGKNIEHIDNHVFGLIADSARISKCTKDNKIIAYKGFKSDMTCRKLQYNQNITRSIKDSPILCSRGFHACLNPLGVFNYYYGRLSDIKFHKVDLEGEIAYNLLDSGTIENKVVTNKITIGEELNISQLFDEFNKFVKKQEEITDN